eukprot:TRINITY_DN162_c0_g2_i1.p1 TRINITY_DN162_c0_g2~~TRINITY_DN162_c0_g2_i1.p1  ORF type:complete len:1116 (-),score=348.36 TRINITY_DN162_c0_g2_i1:874-4221(-)
MVMRDELNVKLRVQLSITFFCVFIFIRTMLLQTDSGKLQGLSSLMYNLTKNGLRALIVAQNSKTVDVLRAFLYLHGISFVQVPSDQHLLKQQRVVNRFNMDTSICAMIMSSRTELGDVTATGADCAILFDHDCTLIGQKQLSKRLSGIAGLRELHVFHLLTLGTVEESLWKLADRPSCPNKRSASKNMPSLSSRALEDFCPGISTQLRSCVLQSITLPSIEAQLRAESQGLSIAGLTLGQLTLKGLQVTPLLKWCCPRGSKAVRSLSSVCRRFFDTVLLPTVENTEFENGILQLEQPEDVLVYQAVARVLQLNSSEYNIQSIDDLPTMKFGLSHGNMLDISISKPILPKYERFADENGDIQPQWNEEFCYLVPDIAPIPVNPFLPESRQQQPSQNPILLTSQSQEKTVSFPSTSPEVPLIKLEPIEEGVEESKTADRNGDEDMEVDVKNSIIGDDDDKAESPMNSLRTVRESHRQEEEDMDIDKKEMNVFTSLPPLLEEQLKLREATDDPTKSFLTNTEEILDRGNVQSAANLLIGFDGEFISDLDCSIAWEKVLRTPQMRGYQAKILQLERNGIPHEVSVLVPPTPLDDRIVPASETRREKLGYMVGHTDGNAKRRNKKRKRETDRSRKMRSLEACYHSDVKMHCTSRLICPSLMRRKQKSEPLHSMHFLLPHRSTTRQGRKWSREQDRKLLENVRKYGCNWSLVASVLSQQTTSGVVRHPRECRDRFRDHMGPLPSNPKQRMRLQRIPSETCTLDVGEGKDNKKELLTDRSLSSAVSEDYLNKPSRPLLGAIHCHWPVTEANETKEQDSKVHEMHVSLVGASNDESSYLKENFKSIVHLADTMEIPSTAIIDSGMVSKQHESHNAAIQEAGGHKMALNPISLAGKAEDMSRIDGHSILQGAIPPGINRNSSLSRKNGTMGVLPTPPGGFQLPTTSSHSAAATRQKSFRGNMPSADVQRNLSYQQRLQQMKQQQAQAGFRRLQQMTQNQIYQTAAAAGNNPYMMLMQQRPELKQIFQDNLTEEQKQEQAVRLLTQISSAMTSSSANAVSVASNPNQAAQMLSLQQHPFAHMLQQHQVGTLPLHQQRNLAAAAAQLASQQASRSSAANTPIGHSQ